MSLLRFMGIKNSNTQDQSVSGESDDSETMKRIAIKLEAFPEEQASYLSAFAYLLGRVVRGLVIGFLVSGFGGAAEALAVSVLARHVEARQSTSLPKEMEHFC